MHGLADIKRMNEDAAARQTVEHKPEDAACPAAEAGVAALGDKLSGYRADIVVMDEYPPAPTGREIAATPAHIMPLPAKSPPDQPWKDYYKHLAAIAAPAVTTKDSHGSHLPTDAKARKALPICTGVLDYFPDALAAVAEVSRIGNDQHNPGQPLHWSKGKSTDHADCALRHLTERGTRDTDGGLHTAKAAWRVLAQLQMEIEAERAGLSFNDYIAKLNREAA